MIAMRKSRATRLPNDLREPWGVPGQGALRSGAEGLLGATLPRVPQRTTKVQPCYPIGMPEDHDAVSSHQSGPEASLESHATRELVTAARGGDGRAWAALDQRFRKQLAVVVRKRLPRNMRARFDTDDVLQTGIVAAYTRLDQFEDKGEGSFRRWLTTVVQNRLSDKLRLHGAIQRNVGSECAEGLAEHLLPKSRDVADDVERAEILATVIERLTELDELQMKLVRSYFLDGTRVEELAQEHGRSESGVRRDLAKAIVRLQWMLKT